MTKPRKPFERIDREIVVQNQWHRYCHDRYVHRDGSEGDYFYIDIAGSSAVVPVLEDGRVVLLRCRRYLLGGDLWEFPIGGIQDGEDPRDVAEKELAEEAGCSAVHWEKLGQFAPYKGVSNEVCHVYLAQGITRGEQDLEVSEDIEIHIVELAEARKRILGSTADALGDGQSMAALAFYDRYLERS